MPYELDIVVDQATESLFSCILFLLHFPRLWKGCVQERLWALRTVERTFLACIEIIFLGLPALMH